MLQPLAISVIGGLLSSMVLSLIFTPAIQFFLQSKQDRTSPGAEPTLS
jgi:Cu/Ag efflux pump CusA